MKEKNNLKAMILAAGLGNRLRPLTNKLPKPMVPIVNTPIMEHVLNTLRRAGVRSVVANLHYQPNAIREHFKDGENFGVEVHYSYEPEPMGTAGGLKIVEEHFGSGPIVVFSGDLLTDIDLSGMLKFHASHGGLATVALVKVADPSRYGAVLLDSTSKITRFQEKPYHEEAVSNIINAGIYVLSPKVLDLIPEGGFYDYGKDLFPHLVEKDLGIFGHEADCYWMDVGGIVAYQRGNFDALRRKIDLEIDGEEFAPHIFIAKGAKIAENVQFIPPVVIGRYAEIGKGTVLKGPVIVGDNCKIGKDVNIRSSILWNGTQISSGATIVNATIAAGRAG